MQNAFHPIQDLFHDYHTQYVASGCKTKGAIERIPQTYLGCPDDAYHRESSRILMIALCARVFEPGCKFDVVTIIRGEQGGRKSELWRVLAHGFFSELPKNFDKTDRMVEAMKGNLISEMGEMAGLRRETAEEAKEFITRQEDKIRLAYARRVGKYKRTSILTGTSNLSEILHDPTGNRRFWIWMDSHNEDNPLDMDTFKAMIPMLWGEAYDEYLAWRERQPHGPLWLDLQNKEARRIRDHLADQVRARTATETVADRIIEWMDEAHVADDIMDFVDDPKKDKSRKVVRAITTAAEVMTELKADATLQGFRAFTANHYGHALAALAKQGLLVKRDKCRAHDQNVVFYTRPGVMPKDPLWMDPPEDPEIDEELNDLLS